MFDLCKCKHFHQLRFLLIPDSERCCCCWYGLSVASPTLTDSRCWCPMAERSVWPQAEELSALPSSPPPTPASGWPSTGSYTQSHNCQQRGRRRWSDTHACTHADGHSAVLTPSTCTGRPRWSPGPCRCWCDGRCWRLKFWTCSCLNILLVLSWPDGTTSTRRHKHTHRHKRARTQFFG